MASHMPSGTIAPEQAPANRRVLLDMVGAAGETWAGMQEHVLILSGQLRDAGWTPILLGHVHYPDRYEQQLKREGIRVLRVPELQASNGLWRSPIPYMRALRRLLIRERIAIYHLHSALVGLEARSLIIAHVAHVPTVITYHCIPWNETRRRRVLMIAMHQLFRPHTIAVSQSVAAMALHNYRVPSRDVATILNGVVEDSGAESSAASGRVATVAPPAGSERSEVVIGVALRLERVKGVDVLLAALAELDPLLPYRVVIAGEGPERAQLEAQAQALDLAARIDFIGFRPDVRQLMRQWGLFVLPSRGQEGLPLSLIEAFAARLPVVATRVGGVPEIVADGMTGWLVAPDDASALAQALGEAIEHPEERLKRGAAGRAVFMAELRADVMARKTIAVYEDTLGAGSG